MESKLLFETKLNQSTGLDTSLIDFNELHIQGVGVIIHPSNNENINGAVSVAAQSAGPGKEILESVCAELAAQNSDDISDRSFAYDANRNHESKTTSDIAKTLLKLDSKVDNNSNVAPSIKDTDKCLNGLPMHKEPVSCRILKEANFSRLLIEIEGDELPQWVQTIVDRVIREKLMSLPIDAVNKIYELVMAQPEIKEYDEANVRSIINQSNVIIRCKGTPHKVYDFSLLRVDLFGALRHYKIKNIPKSTKPISDSDGCVKCPLIQFFSDTGYRHLLTPDNQVNCTNQPEFFKRFNFRRFNLVKVNFFKSDLSEANFTNANVYGSNMTYTTLFNTKISSAQLATAIFDGTTYNGGSNESEKIIEKAFIHRDIYRGLLEKYGQDLHKTLSRGIKTEIARYIKNWFDENKKNYSTARKYSSSDISNLIKEHINYIEMMSAANQINKVVEPGLVNRK